MPDVNTPYGVLHCSRYIERFADGALRACTAAESSPLETPFGRLVPQYTTDDLRKKEVLPVAFHPDGTLKTLPLEAQTTVTTPVGDIAAELISFHQNGAVNRIFPLNGKLSGYWGQDDERNLARPLTLATPAGLITGHVISVSFYQTGALRSVTFWPDDAVMVATPVGILKVRMGVSFSPGGKLRSVEPAEPTPVETPAGSITAFDPDAVGVNGDVNSLLFHDDGSVARVVTTLTRIKAVAPNGGGVVFAPEFRESLCGDGERELVPMTVEFGGGAARIAIGRNRPPVSVDLDQSALFTEPYLPGLDLSAPGLRCGV